MKANLDCIPCFQRQLLKALRMNARDEKLQEKLLRQVMRYLLELDWSKTPPELAHSVHGLIRKEVGVEDPYKNVKKECNALALKMLPGIRREVEKSADPLLTAIRVSIAGNIMDFGPTDGSFNVEKTVEDALGKKFAINDYEEFKEKVGKAKSLLLFADNAGEIAFDRLLIETILKLRRKPGLGGLKVTVAVKGGPIINDATIEDAKQVGLDKIPLVKFRETNNGQPGTGPIRNSPEVKNWIESHDVTISKGQGNYEGLSQFNGLFFMLIAKCNVIASDLGVQEGGLILKYSKGKKTAKSKKQA